MIHTYPEAVEFLYANLPMFQRVGAVAYKTDITNTIRLCEILGNPQTKFKSVHVAGTNGKGSSSHMLASVLQEAGYKTGLYTSPHLKSFTERIRINGIDVSQEFVVDFVNRIRPAIEEIQPSFFEITVAMAFDYFVSQKIDVAVVEVGLGGRLDSTNIITPVVSLITNIGWDHKDILGDTLELIASEKAGIIKPNVPVVVSQKQAEIQYVFVGKANVVNAPIDFGSDVFSATLNRSGNFDVKRNQQEFINNLDMPLKGLYQEKNLPGVLKTIENLNESGFEISLAEIKKGLEKVVANTRLKGRWQKLMDRPLVICDTGHNIYGITEVVRQINSIPYRKLHLIFGVVKDKDVTEVLKVLPRQATCYFCQAKLPRAMDAHQLAEKAAQFGLHGEVIPDVNEARKKALKNALPDDMIFIGGSTFVVAELDDL
jgi:dihydrofolate synthase / folylpolyglutamate synthase